MKRRNGLRNRSSKGTSKEGRGTSKDDASTGTSQVHPIMPKKMTTTLS